MAGALVFKLADFGRSSRAGEDRDGENLGDGRYLPRLNDPSPPARAAMGRDVYALGVTISHAVSLVFVSLLPRSHKTGSYRH